MTEPAIFNFERFGDFLDAWLKYKKRLDRTFTHQSFAKSIGVVSPPLIAMVAKGRRLATPKLLKQILAGMTLNELERAYAETLVSHERAAHRSEQEALSQRLKKMRARPRLSREELQPFRHLLEWHHHAICLLAEGDGLSKDQRQIAALLNYRISDRSVARTVNQLLADGYLIDANGDRYVSVKVPVPSADTPPLVQKLYSIMNLKEATRILTEGTEDRCVAESRSFRIHAEQWTEVVKALDRCFQEIGSIATGAAGGKTFQFSAQIFSLIS